ncbi:MAG: hypothetical protein WB615_06195 [Candidatus Tumulicola sp.]
MISYSNGAIAKLLFLSLALGLAACGGGSPAGTIPAAQNTIADTYHWVPRFTTLPLRGVDLTAMDAQRNASTTIPYYKGSVKSPLDGNTYTYRIVGEDPQTSNSTTNVPYVPIALRVHFADGTVLDPTKPGCNDTVPVENRFFKGPNFVSTDLVSNGVDVGTTQVNDAFQRAEFWTILKGPKYHTMLVAAAHPIVVDIKAPSSATTVPGHCSDSKHVSHRVGRIDNLAFYKILNGLVKMYAIPSQVPITLSYNVVLSDSSGCCILGFHGADGGRAQTFAFGAYLDPAIFTGAEDIAVLTHEIGEVMNDPFVNNATPAWGHVGEVSGCQDNLEVGDPLSGKNFLVTYHGFTYHPQELAFFSWFFRTPSTGTGGLFSFEGTFKDSQGLCT